MKYHELEQDLLREVCTKLDSYSLFIFNYMETSEYLGAEQTSEPIGVSTLSADEAPWSNKASNRPWIELKPVI